VRFLDTDDGLVLFLTVGLPADVDLAAAHRVAGELEEAVRSDQPDLADVVVHTEPALS
jgi:divalent metal cation (Fe/Co/Zn/Cd) transporter